MRVGCTMSEMHLRQEITAREDSESYMQITTRWTRKDYNSGLKEGPDRVVRLEDFNDGPCVPVVAA